MPHFGLGDYLVCFGLFRQLAKIHQLCIVPALTSNEKNINQLFHDEKNIHIEFYKNYYISHMDMIEYNYNHLQQLIKEQNSNFLKLITI